MIIKVYSKNYIIFFIMLFGAYTLTNTTLSLGRPGPENLAKEVAQRERERALSALASARERLKVFIDANIKKIARLERRAALSALTKARKRLKPLILASIRRVKGIFNDGETYFNSRLYREAIATWYDIILLEPYLKRRGDERKAGSLIRKAQARLEEFLERKKRTLRVWAERERRRANLILRKKKAAFERETGQRL
jgi:hypothetical protein